MSVSFAILLAILIVIFTFIVIIFNFCDFILIDKFFPKLSKKNQQIVSFISIVFLLVYIILNLYNFINVIFK